MALIYKGKLKDIKDVMRQVNFYLPDSFMSHTQFGGNAFKSCLGLSSEALTIRHSPQGKLQTKEVIPKLSSKGSGSGYSYDFCLTEQYMQAWC